MGSKPENVTAVRILICGDEPLIAEDLSGALTNLGYEVAGTASSGQESVRMADEARPDIVLMDITLKGEIDSTQAAEQIRSRFDIPVVYLTDNVETNVLESIKRSGAYGSLAKDVGVSELSRTVEIALFKHTMEKRLRESEGKYRELVETVSDGIVQTDRVGIVTFANPAYCRMLGFTREEVMGKSVLDFQASESKREEWRVYLDEVAGRQPCPVPWFGTHRTKDGGLLVVQSDWNYRRDDQGQVIGFIAVVKDMTDRMKAEEALRESEQRFRDLYRNLRDGMAEVDERGRIVRCNPQFLRMLGYSFDEVTQLTYEDITPSQWHAIESRIAQEQVKVRGYSDLYEKEYIHKDGTAFPVEVQTYLLHDRNGKPAGYWAFVRDITERKKAEEKLRQSEQDFRRIIDNLQDPFYRADMNGIFTFLSPASEWVAGYKPEEGVGHPITMFYAEPSEREEFLKLILKNGFVNDFQARLVHKDGHIVWVSTSARVYKDKDGNVAGVEGIARDITDRKKAEETIRRSAERFRSLIDQAADAIFVHDFDGRFLEVNQQACASLGYSRAELLSMSVNDIDPDALSRGDNVEYWLNLPAAFEAEHKRKDGTTFAVEVRLGPIEYEETKVVLSVVRDMTDRKKSEEALRESEAKYRRLHETMMDAFVIVDMDGRIQETNHAYRAMLGYTEEELGNLTYGDLTPEQWHSFEARIVEEQILRNGYSEVYQKEYRKKDGTVFPVELRTFLIRDKDDRPNSMWAIVRDVTERNRAQEELREARKVAEAASRAKSEFLANMSHELRTPLNSIIGFAELLEDQSRGPLNETQRSYAGYIVESGRHLLQLVNQLLDLTKIESGGMDLELSQVSISELLESTVAVMRARALRQHLDLELKVDPETKDMPILADELKLRQVVVNLLANAVKFTPERGKIQVEARKVESDLVVSVCDTGLGIDEADTSRIFKAFEQADSSSSRRHEGTGLGLALARKLVQMHGGRIWVESEGLGNGSTFSFTIPLKERE